MKAADTHPLDAVLRRVALGGPATPAQRRHFESCAECRGGMRVVRALVLAAETSPVGACPGAEEIVLLSEGRLAAGESDAASSHVARCGSCAADLEGLSRARAAVAAPAPVRLARRAATALADAVKALAAWDPPVHQALAVRGAARVPADLAAGLEAYRAGRLAAARAKLESAAAARGAPPDAHFYLAACLVGAGDLDAAVDHLARAARGAPRVAEYQWRLAQALLLAGRADEARAPLRKAATLPGNRKAQAREQLVRLERLLES